MKHFKSILLGLFLTTTASTFANDDKIIDSKISEVTVYSKGAQITRKAKYSAAPGVTKIVIEGVSQYIQPKSLQVKASGDVIIIDSKYSVKYPEPVATTSDGLPLKIRQAIARVSDSIDNISFEIQDIQSQIALYNSAKSVLANNGAIKGQGKVNDSIELLQKAMEYYTQKTLEINSKLGKLNRNLSDKNTRKQAMTVRLRDLQNYQNNANLQPKPVGPTHMVTITVSAKAHVGGNLLVSYMVNQAGWNPLYDLKADVNSENVNLNYKAEVYQNTGIDWEDVRLNISTNNPYQNKTVPDIRPWYLIANRPAVQNRDLEVKTLNTVAVMEESSTRRQRKVQADNITESMDASYSAPPINYNAQQASSYTQVVEHAISAEFKIDLPYTIKSNNEQHMVLIKNVDLKANYKYQCVPKIDLNVYLVAELTELTEHQLVSAKANIFFDGSYVGETYLNPSQMKDTMTLSLGKDPNIIVRRTLMQKETKEKVIGNNRERTYAYNFEVRSLKSRNVEVVIKDQIPITTNPEIEIEATELSRGDLEEKTGFIKWSFKLKAKEAKDFDFKYQIKHDKSLRVNV